jgi:hypothetical protein
MLQQVRREQQLEETAGREFKNKTPLTYGQTIQVSALSAFTHLTMARYCAKVDASRAW